MRIPVSILILALPLVAGAAPGDPEPVPDPTEPASATDPTNEVPEGEPTPEAESTPEAEPAPAAEPAPPPAEPTPPPAEPTPPAAAPTPPAVPPREPEPAPAPKADPTPAATPPAPAVDESEWGGNDDAGFDTSNLGQTREPTAPEEGSTWAVTGWVRSDDALWVQRLDTQPVARARQSGDLALEYRSSDVLVVLGGRAEADLAYRYERELYDTATIEEYESLVRLNESFVAHTIGNTELAFGRQIANYGEGDVISPADVVNPRDLRDPGMADLDDLRLPVLASRATLSAGYHRFEAIIAHEANFGFRTPPKGPYSPLPSTFGFEESVQPTAFGEFLSSTDLAWKHVQDPFDLVNQSYFARWSYKGPGLDVGFFGASLLDTRGVITGYEAQYGVEVPVEDPADLAGAQLRAPSGLAILLDHRRYQMIATTGAVPIKWVVWRWELHQDFGKPFNVGNTRISYPTLDVIETDVVGGMTGLTMNGPSNTFFVEVGKDWMYDQRTDLIFPETPFIWALRTNSRMMRDDLHLNTALTGFGAGDLGFLARGEAAYNLGNSVNVAVGFITYQPTSELGPFSGLTQHDQVYTSLRYDFALR